MNVAFLDPTVIYKFKLERREKSFHANIAASFGGKPSPKKKQNNLTNMSTHQLLVSFCLGTERA